MSSFYCQYLVSCQAFVLVQTWRMLKRCSDNKIITFNIQYITAFWMNSFIHFWKTTTSLVQWSIYMMHKYYKQNTGKKRQESCVGLNHTYPWTDFKLSCLICFTFWVVERIPAVLKWPFLYYAWEVWCKPLQRHLNYHKNISPWQGTSGWIYQPIKLYVNYCSSSNLAKSRQVLWVYAKTWDC